MDRVCTECRENVWFTEISPLINICTNCGAKIYNEVSKIPSGLYVATYGRRRGSCLIHIKHDVRYAKTWDIISTKEIVSHGADSDLTHLLLYVDTLNCVLVKWPDIVREFPLGPIPFDVRNYIVIIKGEIPDNVFDKYLVNESLLDKLHKELRF